MVDNNTNVIEVEVLSEDEANEARPNRKVRRDKRFVKAKALWSSVCSAVSTNKEATAKIVLGLILVILAIAVFAFSWYLTVIFFIWLFHAAPVIFWIAIVWCGLQFLAGVVMAIVSATK